MYFVIIFSLASVILSTSGLPQNYIQNLYNNNAFLGNTGIDSKFLQDIPRDYQFGYVARPRVPLPIEDIIEVVGEGDDDIDDKDGYIVVEAGDDDENAELYRKPASVCQKPRPQSRCYAAHTKWSYNSRTNSCTMFIFGGCGAGQDSNIFDSQEECDNLCVKN